MRLARVLLLCLVAVTFEARAELKVYQTGDLRDVKPSLHGPVLILAGGGGDQSEALQAAIDAVRGCSHCDVQLDAVTLRASGDDSYNKGFMRLDGIDSAVTLVISDRESAMREDVAASVREAELLFFAGGDQCSYIRWIKSSAVAEAIKEVYRRGGAVGGSSAGLAIQGEIVYDACPDQSARSAEALADPFHTDVSLSRGFFEWPVLAGSITDSHFQQRDRFGRLLVFMSRALAEKKETRILGIGVSEKTTFLVDGKGHSRVMGDGPVHLIVATKQAEVLQPGRPLTHHGFRVLRLERGAMVELQHLPKRGWKTVDVIEGKLSTDAY